MQSKYPKSTKFHWYDSILLRIIPPLGALLTKLLMISCRVIKVEGLKRARSAITQAGGGAVYATWHQRMSYYFHYFGSHHLTIMISQSRDGEYATRTAKWAGFKNVRGSSTRGGSSALKELTKRMKQGETGGMLADGPLGPVRVAKIGSVIMARDAEVPLIPILWGADRCWTLNSWDRYLIPKPFSRVVIHYAEPIWVPRSANGKKLEHYRRLLEERLNVGTRLCDEHFGSERPWRKVKGKDVPEVGPIPLQSGRRDK